VNNPTDVKVNTFRVVGTALSANRIEATWSIFGYHSYVDGAGDWQYEQYAWQGGTLVANSGGGAGMATPELDYDGDGVSDLAVYKVVGGQGLWSIILSGGGAPITDRVFGDIASVPVRGDFNGDGNWDMAVFRSNGWCMSVLILVLRLQLIRLAMQIPFQHRVTMTVMEQQTLPSIRKSLDYPTTRQGSGLFTA